MQENSPQTALLDAMQRAISRRDHPLAGVYRTMVSLATRHHAILVDEPRFGGASALCLLVAAEVLGLPVTHLSTHPDLLFLPSDGSLISKEEMQQTIGRLATSPQQERRVVIWEDMTRLNTASANAFLKTLEEPDSATLFLLTTPCKERLLSTITSRVIDVFITPAMLETVTEDLLSQAPDHIRTLCMGRPSLAVQLWQEATEKTTPLTTLMERNLKTAEALLSEEPRRKLEAYAGILEIKELGKKSGHNALQLFSFAVEGTIEKMTHSTMISALPARVTETASRILQFKQDCHQNVSTKLAALDLVFGPSTDTSSL